MSLEWLDDALCAQTDPDAFLPGGSPQRAKAICALCDVRVQCLEFALVNHPVSGVWAGTTSRERRGMVKDAA